VFNDDMQPKTNQVGSVQRVGMSMPITNPVFVLPFTAPPISPVQFYHSPQHRDFEDAPQVFNPRMVLIPQPEPPSIDWDHKYPWSPKNPPGKTWGTYDSSFNYKDYPNEYHKYPWQPKTLR